MVERVDLGEIAFHLCAVRDELETFGVLGGDEVGAPQRENRGGENQHDGDSPE